MRRASLHHRRLYRGYGDRYGKCGGFFPGISSRQPCSLWEYARGDMLAIAMVLAITCWPVILALLVLPPFIGHLYDRQQLHDDN